MPNAKESNKPSHITTGNVLEDLGFSAQEIREMEIKHDLWVPIRAEIEAQKLTQAQLAKVLEIHQPDASLLFRGQITRFSISRLLEFAHAMNLEITVSVHPQGRQQKQPRAPRVPLRKTSPGGNRVRTGTRPAAQSTASR